MNDIIKSTIDNIQVMALSVLVGIGLGFGGMVGFSLFMIVAGLS